MCGYTVIDSADRRHAFMARGTDRVRRSDPLYKLVQGMSFPASGNGQYVPQSIRADPRSFSDV